LECSQKFKDKLKRRHLNGEITDLHASAIKRLTKSNYYERLEKRQKERTIPPKSRGTVLPLLRTGDIMNLNWD
jgi:hypothetical protein